MFHQWDTHVKDLGKWIDPAAHTTVSPLVDLGGYIVQQHGKNWNKNEMDGRYWKLYKGSRPPFCMRVFPVSLFNDFVKRAISIFPDVSVVG